MSYQGSFRHGKEFDNVREKTIKEESSDLKELREKEKEIQKQLEKAAYDNSYLSDWKIERQGDGILCRNI